jgi:soluble lytic murein transglycosylase
MKFFLFIQLFILSSWLQAKEAPRGTPAGLAIVDPLKLQRSDLIIGENIVNLIKLVETGYVNKSVLTKIIQDANKSKHFTPFIPWLLAINDIANLKKTPDLILMCKQYSEKKDSFPLEKVLFRLAGNYCRERTLEAISRDIDRDNTITNESTDFIQQNLKFYLTKKNKKNFAFFIQSQSLKPDILRKLSQEVTTYSVQHEIVPSQEVLKDILINEQITNLIQEKGLNHIQHQNIFYAEYAKLIEHSYKALDSKPGLDKVKEHYSFLKNYLELNQDHLPVGLCLIRLNDFAKSVFRNKFEDLSRDIFQYIIKKNNKEVLDDAIFFYLWTYLSEDQFKESYALAKKYDLIKMGTKIQDPRMKFWLAYLYEELEEPKDAIKLYEDVINNHPLSFYAIMGVKKLHKLKPDSPSVKFYITTTTKQPEKPEFDYAQLDQDYLSSLIRLKAWATIDSQRLIKLELKRLKRHSLPKFIVSLPTEKQIESRSELHLIHARILQQANYLSTFRYLYEVLDKKEIVFNRSLLEILYPLPYFEDLKKALKKDTLDPIVVLSLIRQESVFNPLAQSPVGARGLMQLMPATARRMKRSVRDKHLVNPKINIELGTKYFKGLMNRYQGNLVYVLSAYNAGEGRVERWKGSLFDSDKTILKNIEMIPFLETRNYVKLIFRNIFFYKLLLGKDELIDPTESNKIYDVTLGFKH